jgi:hypothetical protein
MTAMTFDAIAAEVAAATIAADRRIVVSPILRVLSDGSVGSYLYFTLITTGCRFEKVHIAGPEERLEIVGRLFAHRPRLELHFAEDELSTLRLAESFWPCARVTALLEDAEAALAAAQMRQG